MRRKRLSKKKVRLVGLALIVTMVNLLVTVTGVWGLGEFNPFIADPELWIEYMGNTVLVIGYLLGTVLLVYSWIFNAALWVLASEA